ncbi:hypothetical protein FB446DRAFT_706531 [Lentinula raphanica]|nr:hypothetical protein FB446DRAFT_706531 [Lentinula raphanica]KAJ3824984.1 hypothetical protein F5880DRAFT_1611510 [Lentinula raphanica]
MKFTFLLLVWTALSLALQSRGLPIPDPDSPSQLAPRGHLEKSYLIGGFGYQPLNGNGNYKIVTSAYLYVAQPKSIGLGFLTSVARLLHLDVDHLGEHMSQCFRRLKLLFTIGIPMVRLKVSITGCQTTQVTLSRTGWKHLGLVSATEDIGKCTEVMLTVKAENSDEPGTIYLTPPEGFMIISDIDDTIKITDVLEEKLMFENTAYKDPVPVKGMPELYASLSKQLVMNSTPPFFVYISGSPFELHKFLNDFLKDDFPASRGPLLLQNLTISDPKGAAKTLTGGDDGESKVDYKMRQITDVHGYLGQKKVLAVGDSGEMDPETYGDAYRKFGEKFIKCIWIHVLDDKKAKNTQERFDKAFEGVPKERILLFHTSDIPRLQTIEVAKGKCNFGGGV